MSVAKGDRVSDPLDGMVGTVIIAETTAPDAYGETPVALVEWDWKGEKVRTYVPTARLRPCPDLMAALRVSLGEEGK